jgi:hypothetical protein
MFLRSFNHLAAIVGLLGTPVAASAAQVGNPAASLSIAPSARVDSATGGHKSALAGGAAIYAVLILAGIAAIVAIGVSNDNKNDRPNSP